MIVVSKYLLVLLLTVVIELIIALFFGFKKKSQIIVIICINVITNPVLNYLLLLNYHFSIIKTELLLILFLEILVVLAEWRILVYALHQENKKLFILSLVMNSCSYLSGVLIFQLAHL